jgi:hypothetical protein
MLTWFGTRFLLVPEFYSAFSWEDVYSNLIGTELAIRAVQDPDRNYDQAMTHLLNEEMAVLRAVPKEEAIRATNSVKGKWFTAGVLFPHISRRNIDIGLNDGRVTPVLIPGMSDAEPMDRPVPTLDSLQKHGIEARYTIHSSHGADKKMRQIAGTSGPIEPARHYRAIMEDIRKEALQRYGHDIGP